MSTSSATSAAKAPAVATAFRILDYLSLHPRGAGVSDIARSLGVGKSTCFNVLSTMLEQQAVIKDARHAVWRLGPKLVQLGTSMRRSYSHRSVMRDALQGMVDSSRLTCLIGQVLANDQGVVVIDRVLPSSGRDGVVTGSIGEVYPITAPVFGRAILALYDDDDALAVASRSGGFRSAVLRKTLLQKLAEIRASGYATSIGEHEPGLNAVGCAVLDQAGEAILVLCLIGSQRLFLANQIRSIGKALVSLARELES